MLRVAIWSIPSPGRSADQTDVWQRPANSKESQPSAWRTKIVLAMTGDRGILGYQKRYFSFSTPRLAGGPGPQDRPPGPGLLSVTAASLSDQS